MRTRKLVIKSSSDTLFQREASLAVYDGVLDLSALIKGQLKLLAKKSNAATENITLSLGGDPPVERSEGIPA